MKNHPGDAQWVLCTGQRACWAQAGCVAFLERWVWRLRPGRLEARDPLSSQPPVPVAVNRPFTLLSERTHISCYPH